MSDKIFATKNEYLKSRLQSFSTTPLVYECGKVSSVGDGVATAVSGVICGAANTTYGENVAVIGVSKNASVSVIALGADGQTVRISTNYRIEEDGIEVDSEIEQKLYEVLKGANLLAADLTLENFINRDERAGGSIISSQKVGPSVAEDITNGAIISVILAIIAIFAYILIRFRNVAFSVGATTALVFDVLFILGMYAICWGWMPFSLEIDQTFIGAVLTAIGYSINDKVVVFDRIREYFGLYPKRERQDLFNSAINNTLNRTINTSVSTFIVLAVIFCLGGASIRSFAFAMILGVVFGTLSSIFMAAPTAYLTMGKTIKEEADDKK